jgi:phosphate transport system permease protein
MLWLTGGGLVVCVMMIVSLLCFVFVEGASTFWPSPVKKITTTSDKVLMGEVTRESSYRPQEQVLADIPSELRSQIKSRLAQTDGLATRSLFRTGNFELDGEHFNWVSDFEIKNTEYPEWALVIERLSWGRFYGFPEKLLVDGEVVADTPETVWAGFNQYHQHIRARFEKRRELEIHQVGAVNRKEENARLAMIKAKSSYGDNSEQSLRAQSNYQMVKEKADNQYADISKEIAALNTENSRYKLLLLTASGQEKILRLDEIVRVYPANRLSLSESVGVYFSRWWEFLSQDPREANSEGGVFPAIFGTVVMTLIMSVIVVPFGVLAALYLREYAKPGLLLSAIRISINNLAGVPSIVFGVFGLGFFCYLVGGSIDQVFFSAKLPSPTYGTGGILWAALTLALLTLPVVIVATEEALAAVPRSMREGSYACGASKWQTIRRIVLPRAMPGIMTGMILAMARGAGEVAPLMLVGAVKLAPELPLDSIAPFFHFERSFMHLGFHIYDLGFQSQNSEAAKPMVFTTTLLLIGIIASLNLGAVMLRAKLKKRFVTGSF